MVAKRLREFLLVGIGVLSGGFVCAEGGTCPNGFYPSNGPGVNGCNPIPGYGVPQAPQPRWESRWGANASDGPNDAFGVAQNKRSKQEASDAAMRDCMAKGGVQCKINAAYDNQCAAVVVGDGHYNVATRATIDEAVARGIKTCRDSGLARCDAHYTGCSLPVRVQ